MQNKRDQVQAHMFLMGRLTSSMLRADPDSPESPQGRTNRGIAIGVIIAVLVTAGAFVFGLLSPGKKDSWRTSGELIVEKETGARYLFLDGRLRPVRNYASARLLVGADLKAATVSAKSLRGTSVGSAIGIPGGPDRIPSEGQLSDAPWLLCSTPYGEDPDTVSTLAVASEVKGQPVSAERGIVAQGPDGSLYLLWSGMRLRLDEEKGARESLGYGSVAPYKVAGSLLTSLPAGPDLAPPFIPGQGEPGPRLEDRETRIGQVFGVSVMGAKEPRHYVLQQDGLRQIPVTVAALILGDPETRKTAYADETPGVIGLGPEALRGQLAPQAPARKSPMRLPDSPPEALNVPKEVSPCARIAPADPGSTGTSISITLADIGDLGQPVQATSDVAAKACTQVDRVVVPPDTGVLVQVLNASGTRGSTLYLVSGTGLKYRIPTEEAAKALGYETTPAQGLPSQLLGMLPHGPDLSPKAAQTGRRSVAGPLCN
ncbi:type VII secretion protein EccB [Streptomyces sp. NPDC020681]|uniref:type VII secretion protein EccB n=1 Tax=Streptomyces sp. NPDC020681 TaxID=3365083 RepID=UPI0037A8D4D8